MRTIKFYSKKELLKMDLQSLKKHHDNIIKKYKCYKELVEIILEEKEKE